jgi:hypothetical protein
LKANDIAQKLWLKANTRPCPECSVPIEKNEGCNHMTCTNPACCHEFCWICRKDWKLHGTSTGGFFRCNIWQDEDVDESSLTPGEVEPSRSRRGIDEVDGSETDPNNDQGYGTAVHAARMAWRQKYEMARFLHHYTRWEAHKDSASLEKHMADTVCSRLAPVVEAAIDFNGFDDFNFGGKGEISSRHFRFHPSKFLTYSLLLVSASFFYYFWALSKVSLFYMTRSLNFLNAGVFYSIPMHFRSSDILQFCKHVVIVIFKIEGEKNDIFKVFKQN